MDKVKMLCGSAQQVEDTDAAKVEQTEAKVEETTEAKAEETTEAKTEETTEAKAEETTEAKAEETEDNKAEEEKKDDNVLISMEFETAKSPKETAEVIMTPANWLKIIPNIDPSSEIKNAEEKDDGKYFEIWQKGAKQHVFSQQKFDEKTGLLSEKALLVDGMFSVTAEYLMTATDKGSKVVRTIKDFVQHKGQDKRDMRPIIAEGKTLAAENVNIAKLLE